jgi:hypothetical protein
VRLQDLMFDLDHLQAHAERTNQRVMNSLIWVMGRRVADLFVECPRNCLVSPHPGYLKVHNEELWEPCQCGGTGIMPSPEAYLRLWAETKEGVLLALVRYLFGEDGC